MKDYFDQDNLDEFLNEMKANRTKPSKESGERKALRKAWAKKSRDRIFNHPSNMAHGMSMAQKKDAKSQGFSNVSQMQYYQKKKRAGLVARDGDEDQVDEGSIGIKKYLRRSDAARKASSEYDKHSGEVDTYWKIHNKLKPGSIKKREELAKKSSKARNDAYSKIDKIVKKGQFKDNEKKQKQDVDEGSLGQKKVDRLYQAQGKALDAYSADRNPENKAKFMKAAKDTYRKASARLSKIRLKKKDKE